MTIVETWSIPGSDGEPILGNVHRPGRARGVVLLAHGFKGYKDYGMFPRLAEAVADAGLVAHRFNFSHSGMTERIETFERPDLFERDTWNRQVGDLERVAAAVARGTLDGAGLPLVLFGHSRGGVAVLLAAGRAGAGDALSAVAGIVTASAPSGCRSGTPEEEAQLLEQGWIESPSGRTGQALRVGRAFLREQLDDPAGHDLPALAAAIRCPVLLVHGADDATVPCRGADELAAAIGPRAEVRIVAGADHVFNTPNPMPRSAMPSPQLEALLDGLIGFAVRIVGAS